MQLGAAAGAARADVELKGGAGLMLFVSPRSTTASRTATTPAMPPCSGLKVGQLGLGLGQGGAGGSRSHLSVRCSPRCSPRCIPWCTCHPTAMLTPLPSLFQGLAGEEPRATRSSKPQVGACPRSPPPASGSRGWLGLSRARQAGKAGMPTRLSGLVCHQPSCLSPALVSVLGLNLLGSSSSLPPAPRDHQHPLSSGGEHQRLLLWDLLAKTGSVLKHCRLWGVSAPQPSLPSSAPLFHPSPGLTAGVASTARRRHERTATDTRLCF